VWLGEEMSGMPESEPYVRKRSMPSLTARVLSNWITNAASMSGCSAVAVGRAVILATVSEQRGAREARRRAREGSEGDEARGRTRRPEEAARQVVGACRPRDRAYTFRMCIICVDLVKKALTSREAQRHLGEMSETLGDHAREVAEKIEQARRDEDAED
jgi:hypothetical protein